MNVKRITAALVALLMLCGLAACGEVAPAPEEDTRKDLTLVFRAADPEVQPSEGDLSELTQYVERHMTANGIALQSVAADAAAGTVVAKIKYDETTNPEEIKAWMLTSAGVELRKGDQVDENGVPTGTLVADSSHLWKTTVEYGAMSVGDESQYYLRLYLPDGDTRLTEVTEELVATQEKLSVWIDYGKDATPRYELLDAQTFQAKVEENWATVVKPEWKTYEDVGALVAMLSPLPYEIVVEIA